MSVLAVALNPTIDVSSQVERVRPTVKIRTHNERQRPGGGGVNVARVIAELGGQPELLILTGGASGAMLKDALATSSIRLHAVRIAGPTRIAFMVREEETGLEYRFVPEGPEVTPGEIAEALAIIGSFRGDFVVVSGSLPRNAPEDVYAEMARIAARTGAKFILDCPGATLRSTLGKAPVFLIKPSIEELETLAGRRLDENGVAQAASALVRDGAAEFVAVTMGREGALLAGAFGTLRVPSKHVVAKSTVGAGDSCVGALVWFLTEGRSIEEAFRFGVAAGAAAVMAPGTELCQREDVFAIYKEAEPPTVSSTRSVV
ncbi:MULTISPECIES: 1-phosphofructokinase family hexose kinase [Ensifer]|jgi:6-phosphofructokinase 2|uniref:1-phosphofructokinase family hexose kinase n=1 Tax=Ensifer TaxID=106591 RepID=UPI00070953EF|nr:MULTISPECIES: 1-phosphofructokinase family hexose kinase [Ensifer]KQW51082.1 1-phosphofructokinase [Ensifer sp. Root1252]KRC54298.1 1-phosphofructokinase [Ensifer sp. Root231]KRD01632.1 1-phosphofructokinase [Ensifer sp. Root258]NOV16989.1 1-phosphofructokinase family hexose kinase [Ensifer canadensis]